jgi:hypothetical protein
MVEVSEVAEVVEIHHLANLANLANGSYFRSSFAIVCSCMLLVPS